MDIISVNGQEIVICKIGKACFNFTLNVAFVLNFTQTRTLIFIRQASAQLLRLKSELNLV